MFGSMQSPGPHQPNRHERYLLHIPGQIGVYINLRWCPSASNNLLFVPVRSGRSVPSQKRKRGATLLLSLPRYNTVFLGCTESLRFPRTTNQHQFMRQIISHWFVPMLAGGGSRHALNIAGNIHRLLVCLPSDNIARMPIQSKPNILP